MAKTRKVLISGKGAKIVLAVNPAEISISQKRNDKTVDLLNVGTVNVPGKRDLTYISINTFLPHKKSPFYQDGDKTPKALVKLMRKWKNSNKSVRIIISGTNINMLFTVQSVEETYREGQKDIYVNWAFVEDRSSNTSSVSTKKVKSHRGLIIRGNNQEIPKTVTIKSTSKQSLWNLAVKYYQDGEKWIKIAEANNISEPNSIKVGQRLVMPK